MNPPTGPRRRARHAGGPRLAAALAVMAGLVSASSNTSAAPEPSRGPVVTVLPCSVEGSGCGIDISTPALDPAACATDVAGLLQRRGITARLAPPLQGDLCATDPQALVLMTKVTATCPVARGAETPRDHAMQTDLEAGLVLRDCASAQEVGHGRGRSDLGGGRRRLLRNAVDDLGHHLQESRIGRSHPETPMRWMRGDAGGWHSLEVKGGVTDIEESDLNDYFEGVGLDREKLASLLVIEYAYYPWTKRLRISFGIEARRAEWSGEGRIDFEEIHIDPGKWPRFDPNNPRYDPNSVLYDPLDRIDAEMGALGIRGGLGWGIDVTRNQHLRLEGSLAYSTLGTSQLPATIKVEGLPADTLDFRSAAWALSGAVRWEWRIVPRFGVSAAAGWDHLDFGEPNRVNRGRFFPVEVAFTGPTATIGLVGRF